MTASDRSSELNRLGPDERAIVELSVLHGLSDEEIASATGIGADRLRASRTALLESLDVRSDRELAELKRALVARLPARLRQRSARFHRLLWSAVGIAFGLALGLAGGVNLSMAAVLAVGVVGAVAAGLRPGLAACALPVLVFLEGVVPSGLVVPIALIAAALMALGWARLPVGAPLAWALAFATLAALSALWIEDLSAIDRPTQFQGLALALCFMFAAASLLRSEQDLQLFVASFVFIAAATGLTAIFGKLSGTIDRPSGGVGDPNIFAMYEIMALPLALVIAATARKAWARLCGYAAAFVTIGAVLASLSRGGLIALGVVFVLLLLSRSTTLYRSKQHKVAMVCSVLTMAVVGFAALSGGLSERLSDDETAAGSGRVNEWRAGLRAFDQEPVVGLGFGGFYAASNDLLRETPNVDLRGFRLTTPGVRVHNAYIEAAADLGAVGLTLFAGLLISTALAFRRAHRAAVRRGSIFVARVAVALPIALAGFVTASIFLSTAASFALYTLVGLALALNKPLQPARTHV